MLPLLLTIVLSAPGQCDFGAVCSTATGPGARATAEINLTLSLQSSENLAMVGEPLFPEVEGVAAYRMIVRTQTTGIKEATIIDRDYLVLDDRIVGSDQKFAFLMFENELVIDADPQVLVMHWSEDNERLVRGIVYDRFIQRDLIAFTSLKKPVYDVGFYYE